MAATGTSWRDDVMLRIEDAVLVLIDVQGRLADVMHEKDMLFLNLQKLLRAMPLLGVPVIWMEQTPDKMGQTSAPIRDLLTGNTPIAKTTFGCCGNEQFMKRLQELGRHTVALAGIEAHVCVYQTAAQLLEKGHQVEVVADAVSSRSPVNRSIALERMQAMGARLTSVEMLIFELMQTAEHPAFRDIMRIVK